MNLHRTMHSKVKAYLAHRRRAGFALSIAGKQLRSFARFADRSGYRGPLTVNLAGRWALANRRGLALTAARRIEVLRSFARYSLTFDPQTEIPPVRLFGPGHRRLTPPIYTEQEIGALLAASARLHPAEGWRPIPCATTFGLLSATGLRISEATALRRQDVDLKRGLLHIQQAKFAKSRLVPLHPSTTLALQRYARRRDRVMFSTLYNTGARVSELTNLRIADLSFESSPAVRILGKGRKERPVPLWPSTARQIERWLQEAKPR